MSFIDDCISGKAGIDDIDDYIEKWHTGDSAEPLSDYLGMTREEYAKFLRSGADEVMQSIISAHRTDGDPISRKYLLMRINGSERPEICDGAQEAEWILRCIREEPNIKLLEPEPEREPARWIPNENEPEDGNGNFYYNCSRCHAGDLHSKNIPVPYCWKCGAKIINPKGD